jgi:hypothetical protein
MKVKTIYLAATIIIGLSGLTSAGMSPHSDFAVEVVEYSGSFGPAPYDDPTAVLGKPTTRFTNLPGWAQETSRAKLVEAVYNVDLDNNKVVTTIGFDEYIVVKFDHKVVDYPGNPYGQDLIVFGNAFFGGGTADDTTNMNTYMVSGSVNEEPVSVAVSQDGLTWYEFSDGPYADGYFPTQAYDWDRETAEWTDQEMDFTRPVDPNLTFADFANVSAADAIDLYDGSGGGTPFDLRDLLDYDELAVDPNSGFRWIQYVKLTSDSDGEVDAIADVAVCGDPTHPYPAGDITKDCRVDLWDLSVLAGSWLECTYKCE